MSPLPSGSWAALARNIDGRVVTQEDPAYDWLRKPFIARFDDRSPQAVVQCRAPADVAATLAFARQQGLDVAPRSGGHCFAGYSSTNGIVIDLTLMAEVKVDGDVATVGAGTRIGALSRALVEHGLTVPSGSCPSVGIGGTTLGGGLGILGRRYGLTCDHVLGAEVVLADGSVVMTDAERDPDLFWALRGAGGGNFGVVTTFLFQTRPAPRMTNFYLVWDYQHAARAIRAWQAWAPTAPDEMAAGLALTATDVLSEPPIVEVYGAMLGSMSDATELLGRFTGAMGAEPASHSCRELSYRETADFQAGLLSAANEVVVTPEGPVERQGHRFTKSEFFDRPLPDELVDRLVAIFPQDRIAGEYRGLEWAPWGGQYNRAPIDASAFVHRDQLFTLKHAVLADPDASAAEKNAAHAWVSRSWAAVHQAGSGGVYPNFPDPDIPDWPRAYYGRHLGRLTRIKAKYDPEVFFRFEQSIPVN